MCGARPRSKQRRKVGEQHSMEQFYPEIRGIHIGAVMLSGLLFLVRVIGHNLLNAKWPMASPLRYLVWTVDTVLLTAALMLMTVIQQFPFVDAWLTMKLVLLVAYIVIGWWAFRAARKKARIISSVAALMTFLFIVIVARTHNPLGVLSMI
jgi:uncharacterized membrane protein SirB2